jgi:signal peptidase II
MASLARQSPRLLLAIVILTCCVGCGQATKRMAARTLRDAPPRSYLRDTVRLQYALNAGAFLSVGSDLVPGLRFWAFTVVSAGFLAVVVYFLASSGNPHPAKFMAVVLLLAGGVGNLIDRLLQNGLVTDFINLGIGPIRTGIFNLADVALVFGAAVLVLMHLREGAAAKQRSG